MNEWNVTLNDVKRVFMWNLEPSGKLMNVELESRNGILQVKVEKTYGWLARTKSYQTLRMSWWASCRHWKVALKDLFGRVYVVGLT